MITQEQLRCGYQRCECLVQGSTKYCSEYCADADAEHEIEIQCDCKHAPCALA